VPGRLASACLGAVSTNPAPHLLGTITARQDRPVRLDTDHVLLSWVLGREGRRSTTASALIGPDGEVCARAQAIWFAVAPSIP
jgi:hypothetical protein